MDKWHTFKITSLLFQAFERFSDLKKRGKIPHAQDFVNEASTPTISPNAWNRPRCGVPDFLTQKNVRHREGHRQRRFVLHGGRFDKTDLTYKYKLFLKNSINILYFSVSYLTQIWTIFVCPCGFWLHAADRSRILFHLTFLKQLCELEPQPFSLLQNVPL